MQAVVSLMGRSYCGSSFVNLLLSAHSRIFGGGELHRLAREDQDPNCRLCGPSCQIWTADFKHRLRENFDYTEIHKRSGLPVIVDASKSTGWFEKRAEARSKVLTVDVCLVKHPLRHISSFVDNQYYRDNGLNEKILESSGNIESVDLDLDDLKEFVQKVSASLASTYSKAICPFEPNKEAPILLKYEDVVLNRQRAFDPILKAVGLHYEPMIDTYMEAQHHSLGGNSGAYFVVRKSRDPKKQAKWWANKKDSNQMSTFRHDYYGKMSGAQLDNKFASVLPNSILPYIANLDQYKHLCDLFDYTTDLDQLYASSA